MRRSVLLSVVGIELALLSWWFSNLRFETGLDALQYHRMANAIVYNGLAPWVVNPLSYIGIYPGSDSSGVPFLAASFALTAGIGIGPTVLVYDAMLLLVLGLGLFILTRELTNRVDLALMAIGMGSLAYGISTALLWSLDERSFNVAFAPAFLLLLLPPRASATTRTQAPRYVVVGLTSLVMLSAHLNFLLLLPFLILVPVLYEVAYRQHTARRRRSTSLFYFGMISASPLLLLVGLNEMGALSSSGLEYGLESSALFSGSSPLIFLLNAMVFLAARVGAVNASCFLIGLAYLSTRHYLPSKNILIGAFLASGFLGLPIVLYSKDLMTPIFVLIGTVGISGLIRREGRRRVITTAIIVAILVSGSIAFNDWNLERTSRAADAAHWALPGITGDAQTGNLWIATQGSDSGCVYGNNGVALFEVTTGARELVCNGIEVDALINLGTSAVKDPASLRVVYVGPTGASPSEWFSSQTLDKMSLDFARLPGLSFSAGRALLLSYNVSFVVVDMQKPDQTPLYAYQGTAYAPFFASLWDNMYPSYRTGAFAIFRIR